MNVLLSEMMRDELLRRAAIERTTLSDQVRKAIDCGLKTTAEADR